MHSLLEPGRIAMRVHRVRGEWRNLDERMRVKRWLRA